MWCKSCCQDVPGIPDAVDAQLACPRCGGVLGHDAGLDLSQDWATLKAAFGPGPSDAEPPPLDASAEQPVFEPVRTPEPEPSRSTSLRWEAATWELNEKLRHVERVAAASRRRFDLPSPTPSVPHAVWHGPSTPIPVAVAAPHARIAPHAGSAATFEAYYGPDEFEAEQGREYEDAAEPSPGETAAAIVSWLFLGASIMAFSCGACLAAWGGINHRPNIHQLGMPIVLLGVVLLVLGLLPQIFLRRQEDENVDEDSVEPRTGYEGPTRHERRPRTRRMVRR